ncbi:MAG: phosphotransferase [Rickettsiales bacterium]|nr:phosphotransferase [Rickettsiales bacterium]
MAAYTELTKADAQVLVDRLRGEGTDIGTQVESVAPIPEGITNSVYKLTTDKQTVVVTIFEPRRNSPSPERHQEIRNYQQHCQARGIPTPKLIGDIQSFNGKELQITEYVDARPLQSINTNQAHQLGAAIASMHVASKELPLFAPAPHLGSVGTALSEIDGMVERVLKQGDLIGEAQYLGSLANLSLRRLRSTSHQKKTLPQHIVHGDFHKSNVLFDKQGKLGAIIDFEASRNGVFIEDIADAINAFAIVNDAPEGQKPHYHFDTEIAQSLLQAYHAIRPLTKPELEYLPRELEDHAHFKGAGMLKTRQKGINADPYLFLTPERKAALNQAVHTSYVEMVMPQRAVPGAVSWGPLY